MELAAYESRSSVNDIQLITRVVAGDAAADVATANLNSIVLDNSVDRKVREQAVFVLSQRPRDEGVPALISVARTNKDPEIRKKALFWLGQSHDPRALDLFEELLTKK